jgi:hypothetical protein
MWRACARGWREKEEAAATTASYAVATLRLCLVTLLRRDMYRQPENNGFYMHVCNIAHTFGDHWGLRYLHSPSLAIGTAVARFSVDSAWGAECAGILLVVCERHAEKSSHLAMSRLKGTAPMEMEDSVSENERVRSVMPGAQGLTANENEREPLRTNESGGFQLCTLQIGGSNSEISLTDQTVGPRKRHTRSPDTRIRSALQRLTTPSVRISNHRQPHIIIAMSLRRRYAGKAVRAHLVSRNCHLTHGFEYSW